MGQRLVATHCGAHHANAVERTHQVDGNNFFESVEIGSRVNRAVFADGALRPADASRVHECANRAHRCGHLNGVDDVLSVGHVNFAEGSTNFFGEGFTFVGLQVGDDDFGTFLGEHASRGGSDAAGSSGDDCA